MWQCFRDVVISSVLQCVCLCLVFYFTSIKPMKQLIDVKRKVNPILIQLNNNEIWMNMCFGRCVFHLFGDLRCRCFGTTFVEICEVGRSAAPSALWNTSPFGKLRAASQRLLLGPIWEVWNLVRHPDIRCAFDVVLRFEIWHSDQCLDSTEILKVEIWNEYETCLAAKSKEEAWWE